MSTLVLYASQQLHLDCPKDELLPQIQRYPSLSAAQSGTNNDGTGTAATQHSRVLPATLSNVPAAVAALSAGGIIAVPTYTTYGLAVCAQSAAGVAAIYATKQRGDHKPLGIRLADVAEVPRYGQTAHLPAGLLDALLPGPVTLVLRRLAGAPLAPQLQLPTVAIRIPDCTFLRAVCRQHGGALAQTSANISGQQSSLSVEEFEPLWPACAAVFDGGKGSADRAGSTIIDLTQPGSFVVQREGEGLARCLQVLTQFGLEQRQRS